MGGPANGDDHASAVADAIVRSLRPRTAFDAHCGHGLLVGALWDRGVEARGRDGSPDAIGAVRPDVRDYCTVGAVTDRIEGDYDLVVCIGTIEPLSAEAATLAVTELTSASSVILFSSVEPEADDRANLAGRPPSFWLREFAALGFRPSLAYDASFVAPQAVLFERTAEPVPEDLLVGMAELVLARVRLAEARLRMGELEPRAEAAARLEDELRIARAMLEHERQVATHAHRLLDVERARVGDERALAAEAAQRAALIEQSVFWRASAPLRRTADRIPPGARRRLRTGLRVTRGVLAGRSPLALGTGSSSGPRPSGAAAGATAVSAGAVWARKLEPLRVYRSPEPQPSVNVVTDSIQAGYLFGGVGTALILASLLADRLGARLRVVTRHEPGDPARVTRLLRVNGVPAGMDVEVLYSGFDGGADVPATERDVFVSTSWSSTVATAAAVGHRRVAYLLQEDERTFYPLGDEHLAVSELFSDSRIRCVVNSELLFKHLTEGPEPVAGLAERSVVFEPAFPTTVFYEDPALRAEAKVRTFLFYARPNNLRNLYWRGLEAIQRSLEGGVLSPRDWRFLFVGRDIPDPELPGDPEWVRAENLAWEEYARLVRSAHVGMSLIHSPHPSYPPLDLAASGATVVTNTFGTTKLDLSSYCANIICVPPTVDEITDGIARAVALSDDEPRRRANLDAASFQRDWAATLGATVDQVLAWAR